MEFTRAVTLQQVSACDVCPLCQRIFLFGNIYAMRTHLHLIRYLVVTHVPVIECEINELSCRIELQPCPLAHQAGYGIADKRLVAMIGQQSPLPGIGISLAKQLFLFLEFQFIGSLGQAPRGVAASPNLQGIVELHIILLVNIPHAGINIFSRAVYAVSAECIDVHMGQVGQTMDILLGGVILSIYPACTTKHQHAREYRYQILFHKHSPGLPFYLYAHAVWPVLEL